MSHTLCVLTLGVFLVSLARYKYRTNNIPLILGPKYVSMLKTNLCLVSLLQDMKDMLLVSWCQILQQTTVMLRAEVSVTSVLVRMCLNDNLTG